MSARVGSSAVLPCDWRNVSSSHPHVEWRTISETVLEREGEELYQGEGYEDRVDVPEDKLLKGNCSLVLKNIRPGDAGVYESFLLQSRRVLIQTVELSVDVLVENLRTFHHLLNFYMDVTCNVIRSSVTWSTQPRFLLPAADLLYGDADFILQQDVAPAHSARATSTWFKDQGTPVLNQPANSPDLNPIGSLWGTVRRKMRYAGPNTAGELKATIRATWALNT
ncbi:hypothetical protein NFI96_015063 [Prochilodus magdalenae]|nr:hypothetical protein NFI96_015063 [Prochilodus magdalenae]